MKEIKTKEIQPSIRNLLSYATSESKIVTEYNNYLKGPNRKLFGVEQDEEYIGCIGIEIVSRRVCMINHIAVFPEQRGKRVGSEMINLLAEQFLFIIAETDKDAVDFYKKYGFTISSLGEKYPGVERFLCTYERPVS